MEIEEFIKEIDIYDLKEIINKYVEDKSSEFAIFFDNYPTQEDEIFIALYAFYLATR